MRKPWLLCAVVIESVACGPAFVPDETDRAEGALAPGAGSLEKPRIEIPEIDARLPAIALPDTDDSLGRTVRIAAPEDVVRVKFKDGLYIRLQPQNPKDKNSLLIPVDLRGGTLASGDAAKVLEELQGAEWARSHIPGERELNSLRAKTQAALGKAMPDLNLEFSVRLPKGMSLTRAIELLAKLPGVERARRMPDVYLADAPDYSEHQGYIEGALFPVELPYQRYLDASPVGVDARYAWNFPGGDGAGVSVIDIESAFDPTHPDLPFVTLDGISFPADTIAKHVDHGTATLGVMVGQDNGYGVKGIAHAADPYFLSQLTMWEYGEGGASGIEGSLAWAIGLDGLIVNSLIAGSAKPGDVLVLEVQIAGPNRPEDPEEGDHTGLVPAEWDPYVFDSIRYATANGFVVVEAAGNGKQNLDGAQYQNDPNAPHRPFYVDSKGLRPNDSGAIIVGAGRSNWEWFETANITPRERMDYSNYGRRLDVQAWGEMVTTAGPPLNDGEPIYDGPDGVYRSDYRGTSSATSIIGGVVTSLQGVYKASSNADFAYLSSKQIRQLLVETGVPQQGAGATTEHIGPLPNLQAAIERILFNGDELVQEDWDTYCAANATEAILPPPEFSLESGPVSPTGPVQVHVRFGEGVYVGGSTIYFTLDGSEPNTLCPNEVWPPVSNPGNCTGTWTWELSDTENGYVIVVEPDQLPVAIRARTSIQWCWNAPGQHLESEAAEIELWASN